MGIAGLGAGLAALGHQVVPVAPGRPPRGRLLKRLAYNISLPRRLKGDAFDLVVGFDWDGLCYRPDAGVPYVVSLKGVAADEARFERGLPRAYLRVQAALEGRNARRADRLFVPSRYSAERAVDAYGLDPERVAVVPEGIDLAAWRGFSRDPSPHPSTVLSVARQYPRKNTRTLIDAMVRVRARVPDARLRVVGGGPELPALRQQVAALRLQDAVALLGPLPDDTDVRREYAAADVFCLPSRQEGFGIVFLEAMAAGLPVVAGDAGAAPEVVPDGEVGLLAPPDDTEALAETLVRLLAAAGLRKAMGDAGRARVAGYDWSKVAARFLEAVAP